MALARIIFDIVQFRFAETSLAVDCRTNQLLALLLRLNDAALTTLRTHLTHILHRFQVTKIELIDTESLWFRHIVF